jgi:hypothetical protein
MNIKEEEFSDRSILEWLATQLMLFHKEKYGEGCEITMQEDREK